VLNGFIAPGVSPLQTGWHGFCWIVRSAGMSTCAGCHRTLGFGRFLTCLGQNWHPSCFKCRHCNVPISDREVISLLQVVELTSLFTSSGGNWLFSTQGAMSDI
jgi:hypothetical protein